MAVRSTSGPMLEGTAGQALRRGWGILLIAFGMSFVVNLLRLAGPIFMILIYDRVLPSRSEETLVALFVMVAALLVTQGILDYARRRILARFGAQFQERLEVSLFATTSQNDLFEAGRSKPSAGLDEVDGLRTFFHSGTLIAIFDFFWTPMFILVVFVLNPLLGWVCLGGMAVMLVLMLIQMAFMGARVAESVAASKKIGDLKTMMAASRDVVRGQEMTGGFKSRWIAARSASRDKAITLKDWTGWFDSLTSIVVQLVRYGVLATGAWLTLEGILTVGAMVAATFLVSRVLTPIDRFMAEIPNIAAALRHWGRLKRIMAAQEAAAHFADVAPAGKPRLTMDNVLVKSPATGAAILKGVSLTLAPGEMVEITGGSGRGKTVLAETMLGIWRRSGGSILVDGVNIARLSDADSASTFGYVPEVPAFVAGTLAENIAHLDPVPDPVKVAGAARRACLNATITALPDGYQTQIDPACSLLSRGQRHQLALARALYHDPRILVLDEPDAMLLEGIPKTFDATLNQFLAKGGAVVILSRKRLALKQISTRYVLEAGKLKPAKPPLSAVESSAKVTVLGDKKPAPKPLSG
jgi:ABC-type protease/lipase transport system fused ATPase/permease subunit